MKRARPEPRSFFSACRQVLGESSLGRFNRFWLEPAVEDHLDQRPILMESGVDALDIHGTVSGYRASDLLAPDKLAGRNLTLEQRD